MVQYQNKFRLHFGSAIYGQRINLIIFFVASVVVAVLVVWESAVVLVLAHNIIVVAVDYNKAGVVGEALAADLVAGNLSLVSAVLTTVDIRLFHLFVNHSFFHAILLSLSAIILASNFASCEPCKWSHFYNHFQNDS